jgi:hypothetical protein
MRRRLKFLFQVSIFPAAGIKQLGVDSQTMNTRIDRSTLRYQRAWNDAVIAGEIASVTLYKNAPEKREELAFKCGELVKAGVLSQALGDILHFVNLEQIGNTRDGRAVLLGNFKALAEATVRVVGLARHYESPRSRDAQLDSERSAPRPRDAQVAEARAYNIAVMKEAVAHLRAQLEPLEKAGREGKLCDDDVTFLRAVRYLCGVKVSQVASALQTSFSWPS